MVIKTNFILTITARRNAASLSASEANPQVGQDRVTLSASDDGSSALAASVPIVLAVLGAGTGALGASAFLGKSGLGIVTSVALSAVGIFAAGLVTSSVLNKPAIAHNTHGFIYAGMCSTLAGASLGGLTGSVSAAAGLTGSVGLLLGMHHARNYEL